MYLGTEEGRGSRRTPVTASQLKRWQSSKLEERTGGREQPPRFLWTQPTRHALGIRFPIAYRPESFKCTASNGHIGGAGEGRR